VQPGEGRQTWQGRRFEGTNAQPPAQPNGERRWSGEGDRRWQDRGDGRRQDGRNWQDRGADRRWDGGNWQGRGEDRRWEGRGPDRQDYPRWERGRYPQTYRSSQRYRSAWRAPPGYFVHSWTFGEFLPRGWYGSDWWLSDPWTYDLPAAPPGLEWVRVGYDALLVDEWDGRVVQVVRDVFW